MENSFQTSFIPKKPVVVEQHTSSGTSTSLFTVLSVLILVLVGAAAGGLYLWKNYLITQKHQLSDSLGKVGETFEQETISKLELYDKRVSAARQVLTGHIVLSPMFELLGKLTLPSIQYTKFQHTTTDKGFTVSMSGVARDYRSIALQADVFNSNEGRSFRNVVFSNLTKNKDNTVGFDVGFIVDQGLLSYQKNVALDKAVTKDDTTTSIVTPTSTTDTIVTPNTTTQTSGEQKAPIGTLDVTLPSKAGNTPAVDTSKPTGAHTPTKK